MTNSIKKRQVRRSSSLTEGQRTEPHRIFMKISTLEMEKAHRYQERQKALQRVQMIDERIQEIDSEVTHLLSKLDLSSTQTTTSVSSTPQPSVKTEPSQPQGQKLILKY